MALSGSWLIGAMEGTLASGGEIWLRDVGSAKSGLVLERWWVDHRMRTVVIGADHARKGKDPEKARQREKIRVVFLLCFAYDDMLLNCCCFFLIRIFYRIQLLVVHGSTPRS